MLKTAPKAQSALASAYHLGEGRVLKTLVKINIWAREAYHLGEGRVLKTESNEWLRPE